MLDGSSLIVDFFEFPFDFEINMFRIGQLDLHGKTAARSRVRARRSDQEFLAVRYDCETE